MYNSFLETSSHIVENLVVYTLHTELSTCNSPRRRPFTAYLSEWYTTACIYFLATSRKALALAAPTFASGRSKIRGRIASTAAQAFSSFKFFNFFKNFELTVKQFTARATESFLELFLAFLEYLVVQNLCVFLTTSIVFWVLIDANQILEMFGGGWEWRWKLNKILVFRTLNLLDFATAIILFAMAMFFLRWQNCFVGGESCHGNINFPQLAMAKILPWQNVFMVRAKCLFLPSQTTALLIICISFAPAS